MAALSGAGMKGRIVVLDEIAGRKAAALLVDGVLEDVFVDPPGDDALLPGAVFRGILDRPMKGQGGIFVRLPGGTGFLRGTEGARPGARVIVQVSGVAEPGKAVPLTQRVLFKGQLAIVTPGAGGINVARRVEPGAAAALRALGERVMAGAPEDLGLILRSAAEGADPADVAAEAEGLRDLAQAVMADLEGGAELLLDAPDAHERAARDWAEPAPDAVHQGAGEFAAHEVDALIARALAPEVALPGGGSMVIEATRALVAVDVNTGGDTSPAAALKANIAAARALPRELRLRGLGGQVVIDFAPVPKRDRPAIVQSLTAMFRNEGAETSLAGWTALGLFELQRKRDRLPLARALAGWQP